MGAVDQWRAIEAGLDSGWDEVSLAFVAEDRRSLDEAAGVLGPLGAGRHGSTLRGSVTRLGGGSQKLARTGTLRFLCDPHAITGMKGSAKIVR